MEKIVGIKFKNAGKLYYFAPGKDKYEKDMGVIVETAKGIEYATVVIPYGEVEDDKIVAPLKPIIRIATQKDKEQLKKNEEKRPKALKIAQEKAEKNNLVMKFIDCEFTFDGTKVVFFFTADGRVDFRNLVKDLSQVFHLRIELRQVGIRDEIKIMGGIAPCGRECCCSSCMPDFKKVSIKMAKNQGLSLNPGKISGLCGRLMCCLAYENGYYADACKKVPKIGSEVTTPDGKGMVVNVNMLKMQVKVKIEDKDSVSYHDYDVDKIKFKRPAQNDKSDDDDDNLDDELKKIID
jgi:cell fate regulator YaaT (PSP1 superfamily)